MENVFRQIEGVTATAVGYTGGTVKNPTYQQVCWTNTGHAEAVRIQFDPNVISYEKLLGYFWANHDPCQAGGQGVDIGDQYRSVIFYHSEEQRKTARKSVAEAQKGYESRIVTQIVREKPFYMAEDYHQQYNEKTGKKACNVKPPKVGGGDD